ncbi:hypothetical protein L596_018669 [Steinernema carpocapsae]|uniref:26S proteasome non-ATPase regulatory subunit 5 n=1 Tax=Steinernema carpocapsae TaxID=34508 RepID=A0A4U5N5B9_STECR|nr:hypothetical protein L596_018669 [Steinernema carpocapsae]
MNSAIVGTAITLTNFSKIRKKDADVATPIKYRDSHFLAIVALFPACQWEKDEGPTIPSIPVDQSETMEDMLRLDVMLAAFSEVPNLDFETVKDVKRLIDPYFTGTDVLLNTTILDSLTKAVEKAPRLADFLEESGYIRKFAESLQAERYSPDIGYYYQELQMFFLAVYSVRPALASSVPGFLDDVFQNIIMFDQIGARDRVSIFTGLFSVAKSGAGRQELDAVRCGGRSLMLTAMQKAGVNIATSNSTARNQLLDDVKKAFKSDNQQRDSAILQRWFEALNDDGAFVRYLITCMNTVDSKQACKAMDLAMAWCDFEWGLTALFNDARFMEFLLDRSIRTDSSDAKHKKCDLMKKIVDSSMCPSVTEAMKQQMRLYLRQGAYYSEVPHDVQVATMGGN